MKELYLKFLKSGLCKNCGSQRCDQSLEWVEGCQKWKKFLKQHKKS